MRVLVVGQGGREHALVYQLKRSPSVTEVYCAPGNPGTGVDATNVFIQATDTAKLVEFAIKNKIDLTVVGPEIPLVNGIVDEFLKNDLKIFGPTKKRPSWKAAKSSPRKS